MPRPTPLAEVIRKVQRDKRRIPAPPRADVVYGEITDQDLTGGTGDQLAGGISYGDTGQIRVPSRDRFTLAHELFHALDDQVLTDADRARFQKVLRLKPGVWDTGTGTRGRQSPSEIAADYYAAVATGMDPRKEGVSSYVSDYGPRRMRRFQRSLTRLMDRRGLSPLDLDSY